VNTRQPEIDVKVDIVFEAGPGPAVLQVRPHPDSPRDTLELCTATKDAKEYFGEISVSMTKAQALAVAKALTIAAQYLTGE
jgi:hypothetical protein